MSDRSELMKWVLLTWDYSREGQQYLEWFLQPGIERLDGGAILREAVLDLIEDDRQLNKLRQQKRAAGLEPMLSTLTNEKRSFLQKATENLDRHSAAQKEAIRGKASELRKIRKKLNLERLDALKLVSHVLDCQPPDEILSLLTNSDIASEVAAKMVALSRTSTEMVDIEKEWGVHSAENPWTDAVKRIAEDPGEDGFDNHREKFDRFYAQQVVKKLDDVIDRVANLTPLSLDVKSPIVTKLFREAHDAFLFGFDAAAIALCRSLVEHALKDKLSITTRKADLEILINDPRIKSLLSTKSSDNARKVQRAGNKIMHDVANLQHTAHEVLDCTRQLLNDLYEVK